MEPATACKKPASVPLPLPPALFLVRARSRATRVADQGDAAAWPGPPDTPPRRSPVTVPFLWEEAPGKPKAPPPNAFEPVLPEGASGDQGHQDKGHAEAEAEARPVPLKLPPRLQHVPSSASAAAADISLSPKAVLQGPYHGCAAGGKRPPRRTWSSSGVAAFRRTPRAGVGLFSRIRSKPASAAAGTDAPWCSPAASSASSSSSTSASCYVRDHYSEEDEDSAAAGRVRITRFRRNRSLPAMTTSHLWASIRRSVKQITPWS